MSRKPSQTRACDGCYLRKVKCSEHLPCRSCVESGLRCTFERAPGRRGPKTRTFTPDSRGCFIFIDGEVLPIDTAAFEQAEDTVLNVQNALERSWEKNACLQSIIDLQTIRHAVLHCKHDRSSQSVIIAVALYLSAEDEKALQIPMKHCDQQCDHHWRLHLRRCVLHLRQSRVQLDLDVAIYRSKEWIPILFLISLLYEKLDEKALSWFYLQDAITMLQMGADLENTIHSNIGLHLAVTERIRAISERKSVCIDSNIAATSANAILAAMYDMLRPFNNSFLAIWNNPSSVPSVDYITRLQNHTLCMQPDLYSNYCLLSLQSWLLLIVWHLSLRLDDQSTGLAWDAEQIVASLARASYDLPKQYLRYEILVSVQTFIVTDILRQYSEMLDLNNLLAHQQSSILTLNQVVALLES